MSNSNLPDTLIIVCAHAVYVGPSSPPSSRSTHDSSSDGGGSASGADAGAGEESSILPGDDEANEWYLESFQLGEADNFVKHVEEGVRLHAECLGDGSGSITGSGTKNGGGNGSGIGSTRGNRTERGRSLLVFSGGAVKTGLVHRGVKMGVGEKVGMRAGDGKDGEGTSQARADGRIEGRMGARTEAGGYMALAKARNYFGFNAVELEDTMLVEEYSTDSFQNVLFGLIVYYKHISESITTMYPNGSNRLGEQACLGFERGGDPLKKLICVSHAFKEPRFMHLHLRTLRFPMEKFEFVGIDPPWTGERREDMVRGERERGYKAWEEDGWGVGAFLSGKRREMGWDADVFVREVLREGWEGAEGWRDVFEKLVMGEDVEDRGLPWEERIE